MHFVFLQCCHDGCRFRFPASAAEAGALVCPRCRGPLRQVAATTKVAITSRADSTAMPLVGLLDNIRSIHNVGSMFRSADGAGASHLHLAGITATPTHPKLAKAALGAQETVTWTYHPNGVAAAEGLKAAGVKLWALERMAGLSEQPSLFNVPVPGAPIAVVVGNEKAGVDPGILELCDAVVSLPMFGRKSSLNVAVAFGIALYFLRFGAQTEAREPGGRDGHDWPAGQHTVGHDLVRRLR